MREFITWPRLIGLLTVVAIALSLSWISSLTASQVSASEQPYSTSIRSQLTFPVDI